MRFSKKRQRPGSDLFYNSLKTSTWEDAYWSLRSVPIGPKTKSNHIKQLYPSGLSIGLKCDYFIKKRKNRSNQRQPSRSLSPLLTRCSHCGKKITVRPASVFHEIFSAFSESIQIVSRFTQIRGNHQRLFGGVVRRAVATIRNQAKGFP